MTALVAIGMVWSTANWFFNPRYSKEDIRSAAAYLIAEVEDEDAVIISSIWVAAPLRHYDFAIPKDAVLVSRKNVTKVVSSIPQLEANTTGRIWLVESYACASDREGRLREVLDTLRLLLIEKSWPGVSVRCYAKVNETKGTACSSRNLELRLPAAPGSPVPMSSTPFPQTNCSNG